MSCTRKLDDLYDDGYVSKEFMDAAERDLEETLQAEIVFKREQLNGLLLKRELLKSGLIGPDGFLSTA